MYLKGRQVSYNELRSTRMEAILYPLSSCGAGIHRHRVHSEIHSDFLQIETTVGAEVGRWWCRLVSGVCGDSHLPCIVPLNFIYAAY